MSNKEPKFKIGQVVWKLEENKVWSGKITGVHALFSPSGENLLEYYFGFGVHRIPNEEHIDWYRGIDLFPSKEDLIKSL